MKRCFIIGLCLALSAILLAACGSQAPTTPSAQSQPTGTSTTTANEVHVILTDNTITSSITNFRSNIPYTFVVTNKGHASHDFIIRTRIQGPATQNQTQQGLLYALRNPLAPGATTQFIYDFPISTPQSNVQFAIQLPSPKGNGISIPVQVHKGA
jgi:ABC-type glycerol-3-phosphate transport system substrate-binding protein